MKKINLLFFAFVAITATLTFTACQSDDDDKPTDEQELITTIELTFVDGNGQSYTFTASDTDGDGGNPPVVDDIQLPANTSFALSAAFRDESGSTPIDITEEVEEEAAEHLVCYETSGAIAAPTNLDVDANGDPLGLNATISTGDAGAGTLRITLKHEPAKDNANPCSTGETDADQTFAVTVQ